MLSPADIKTQAQRKYFAVLRALITGEKIFPMEVRFGHPATTSDWATLQAEITALAHAELGCQIEWEEINTRRWGRQRLPVRVCFATEDDYFRLLGKVDEVRQLRTNLALTRDQCPALESWLAAHVARLVEHSAVWPDVLRVCRYFITHPRPGRYARELPIPVGTKFIEENRPLFRSLFEAVLPSDCIDTTSDHFETRYGLRFDEPLVRLRVLDHRLASRLAALADDLSLPLSQFQRLSWSDFTVVTVENRMTFLTLPPLHSTVAIWGAGNAAALLGRVSWLQRCRLFYWGDMDVHGFHILAQLRRTFPRLQSVLMDANLLEKFAEFRVEAADATYENTTGLTEREAITYTLLREQHTLLEQEKIPHAYAAEVLRMQIESSPLPP